MMLRILVNFDKRTFGFTWGKKINNRRRISEKEAKRAEIYPYILIFHKPTTAIRESIPPTVLKRMSSMRGRV